MYFRLELSQKMLLANPEKRSFTRRHFFQKKYKRIFEGVAKQRLQKFSWFGVERKALLRCGVGKARAIS
jgi:hypothetical protein